MFPSKKSARHAPNPPYDPSKGREKEQPTASPGAPRSMPDKQNYENDFESSSHEPSAKNFAVKSIIGPKRGLVQADAYRFVTTVELRDYRGCDSFLQGNPDLLEADEQDLQQSFVVASLDALNRDKNRLAAGYIEKYAIIRCIRRYRELKKPDFLRSLIQKDRAVVDQLHQTIEKIKENRDKTLATRVTVPTTEQASKINLPIHEVAKKVSAPVSDQHVVSPGVQSPRTSSKQLERYAMPRPDPDTEDDDMYGDTALKRHHRGYSSQDKGKGRATEDSTALVKDYHYPSGGRVERDRGQQAGQKIGASRTSEEEVRLKTLGRLLTADRLRSLQPTEWFYFRVGKVFAIQIFDEDTNQSNATEDVSIESPKSNRGTPVLEKTRPMILVKERDGHGIAVPIFTYGGKGLNKIGLSPRSIEAHARIYLTGQKPRWLPGERRTPKRDIEVKPEPGEEASLLEASRVCFEKQMWVEYNRKIIKIGTVSQESRPFLQQYVQEEDARVYRSKQGEHRRQISQAQEHESGSRPTEHQEYGRQQDRAYDSRPGDRSGQGAGARQQPSSREHHSRRESDDRHHSGHPSHHQKGHHRR